MPAKTRYGHLSRATRRTDIHRTIRPDWGLYYAKFWRGVDPKRNRPFPGVMAEVSGFLAAREHENAS